MIAWVSDKESSTFSIKGNPKAAVFPVPVDARPIKSCSWSNKKGIAEAWIGVGVIKPNFFIDDNVLVLRPN